MEDELNRAKTLWRNWEQIEKQLGSIEEILEEHPMDITRQKYDYLREGLYRLSEGQLLSEKPYLEMVRAICNKLQKQLYPNRALRLLHQLKLDLHDRPKAIRVHTELVSANLSALKKMFHSRGLDLMAERLSAHLDYERSNVSFKVISNLDKHRTVSLTPQFEKDDKGHYQLGDIKAQLYGSHYKDDVLLMIPSQYNLNKEQILNLVQDQPVYLFPNKNGKGEGVWLELGIQDESGQFTIHAFDHLVGYDLKRELENLAVETGIYRITAADVLLQLQLGNAFQLRGHHPRDEPFLIRADPTNCGIKILDKAGNTISRESLLEGLKHDPPDQSKTVQNAILVAKNKEPGTELNQAQSL